MHVVIFEGSYWKSFLPIAISRPVFTMASGMSTLLDKQLRHLHPTRLTLWVRPELEEHCRLRIVPKMSVPTAVNEPLDDEPALLVSGRTLHFQKYESPGQPAVAVEDGELVHSAFVHSPGLSPADVMQRSDRWLRILELPRMPLQSRLVHHIWDLIEWNEESLIEDSTKLAGRCHAKPAGAYHLINDADVCLGKDAKIGPGVVLDASHGPIVVDDQAIIGANSVLEGPCYIGPAAQVRALTLIRPGCSIGTMCKVGGELSKAIILGWSNKAHDGYLGDSYIGKWVNLGAGTTTSNLKNTYGEITMKMGSREIPTGKRFLGSLIGDHTKTAIGTRLMTGTYIGFCCLLASSGLPPRFLPSFSFWTDKGLAPYRLDKAIDVTQRVFQRRDRAWTDFDQRLMEYAARVTAEVEQ